MIHISEMIHIFVMPNCVSSKLVKLISNAFYDNNNQKTPLEVINYY